MTTATVVYELLGLIKFTFFFLANVILIALPNCAATFKPLTSPTQCEDIALSKQQLKTIATNFTIKHVDKISTCEKLSRFLEQIPYTFYHKLLLLKIA